MSKTVFSLTNIVNGIADFAEDSLQNPNQVAWCRSIDYRTNPNIITLLPKTTKESGSVTIDLPKWGEIIPATSELYYYGNAGNLYSRTSAGSHTRLRTVANSHGNGLGFFQEDGYLYYTSDNLIGRYGSISSASPTFVDDFFGSQGGVPLNTNSVDFESGSSQYASRADTASLSITGDLAIDMQVKIESLPTVGTSRTLLSKWDESGATRSYIFDIAAISGYFGNGSDGTLTVSANATQTIQDANCTGTLALTALAFTNGSSSFASALNKPILIYQTQGNGSGTWMRNTIVGVSGTTSGTLTMETPLNISYVTGAQIIVLSQYTTVTINSGVTWKAVSWDGSKGGLLVFLASTVTNVNGVIAADGVQGGTNFVNGTAGAVGGGFRGGNIKIGSGSAGQQGEGETSLGAYATSPNNAGGGGGSTVGNTTNAGGGGGNVAVGGIGQTSPNGGSGGNIHGNAQLTSMLFGGGGGGGGKDNDQANCGGGGSGGGIIFITSVDLVINNSTGQVTAWGGLGGNGSGGASNSGGGGGAGGSILFKVQTATLGTERATAYGRTGGGGTYTGGNGANGRIHIDYLTSYTGTTAPAIDAAQDNTLVTTTSYQLRLGVSSTGSNVEYLTKTVSLTTGVWQQLGVSWNDTISTAEFIQNGVSLGTSVGVLTAIHDNASTFQLAMNKNGAGAAANFYDGLMDEVRLYNTTKTVANFLDGLQTQIAVNAAGLVAYYKLNGDYADATANTNTLTATGSPVFSSSVPFPSPTTRLDIDKSADTSGNTYAVPTAISESTLNRLTFTPLKDPQKSIQFNVSNIGTGTWTITIHDKTNNVIATSVVANASMSTGDYEFTYSSEWSPLLNAPYHAHITVASGSPTVVTTTSNALETADFVTYFQFLTTNTAWHPIETMLDFQVFGNGRYVAKWDTETYNPNRITLPAQYNIRCFAFWHEFIAFGTYVGLDLDDFDLGRIFFWDGIQDTYNFYIDVPEGAINSMLSARGILYVFAGYQGDLLAYQGGDTAVKIKRIPKITANASTGVFPGAMTMWRTLLHFGASGEGTTTLVEKGAYSWGSLNKNITDSLSYDYPISTGTRTGANVKVGMVVPVENKLLIGWQDGASYGVDVVNPAGNPFTSGTVETLIQKDGYIWRDQTVNKLRLDILPLATGESATIKLKINRETLWQELASANVSTVFDDTTAPTIEYDISTGRSREYQLAYDLFATGSTSPDALGISVFTEDQDKEGQF